MYLGQQPYPGRAVYLPNRRTVYGMGQASTGVKITNIILVSSVAFAAWWFLGRKKKRWKKGRESWGRYKKSRK
jgi:hypothetical protein